MSIDEFIRCQCDLKKETLLTETFKKKIAITPRSEIIPSMRQCVSHHYACDCREAAFQTLRLQLARYKAALIEIVSIEEGEASLIAKKVINEIRDETRERRQKE